MPKSKLFYNGRCVIEDYTVQVRRESFKSSATNYANFDALVFTRFDKAKTQEKGEHVEYNITPPARLLQPIILALQYLKMYQEEENKK